jgi:DNA-binding SARP family transcriptional activator
MEFRILGPVEVWSAGKRIDVGHVKQRSVLAVLLLDLGRVVPIDVLVDRVWGASPPASVRNNLYAYVAKLRSAIASAGEPAALLVRRSGGYLLNVGRDQVDLYRFRDQVAQAAQAAAAAPAAAAAQAAAAPADEGRAGELLSDALALWRGPALAGLTSPWLNSMRDALEQQRVGAVLDLGDIALREGEHAGLAVTLAGEAIAHPADERLIGQLMLGLYRSGRQAEALRWFEQTRRHLAEELGADPGPPLAALHRQILRSDREIAWGDASADREVVTGAADEQGLAGRSAELAELHRLQVALSRLVDSYGGKGPAGGDVRQPGLPRGRPSWRNLMLTLRGWLRAKRPVVLTTAVVCVALATAGIVWLAKANDVAAVARHATVPHVPAAPAAASHEAPERVITPLYAAPTSAYWSALAKAAPTTRAAIVDICAPDGSGSGCNGKPADAASPEWPATVKALRRAGVVPLYYVSTKYGSVPLATVETEVSHAITWYGTTGVFYDQVPTSCSDLAYYRSLYNYAHRLGDLVMLDPGGFTASSSCYLPTADILQIFVGSQAQFQSATFPSWLASYPSSRFAAVVNSGTRAGVGLDLSDAARDRIGNLYVNDEKGTPNFSTLPAFWPAEIADAHARA